MCRFRRSGCTPHCASSSSLYVVSKGRFREKKVDTAVSSQAADVARGVVHRCIYLALCGHVQFSVVGLVLNENNISYAVYLDLLSTYVDPVQNNITTKHSPTSALCVDTGTRPKAERRSSNRASDEWPVSKSLSFQLDINSRLPASVRFLCAFNDMGDSDAALPHSTLKTQAPGELAPVAAWTVSRCGCRASLPRASRGHPSLWYCMTWFMKCTDILVQF